MKLKLLCTLIQYYSDQLYTISENNLVPAEKLKTSKILILARHHYIEKTLVLPITIKKDVKAAIAFEVELLQNDFIVFSKIVSTESGKTSVMLWQIPKTVVPKGFVQVIPETYLLSHQMKTDEVLTYIALDSSSHGFIVKNNKGYKSIVNSSQPITIYSQANGVYPAEIISITSENFAQKLSSAYFDAFLSTLSCFWLIMPEEKQELLQYIKPFLLPFGVFFSCYLAISSLFLMNQFNSIEEQVFSQKSEISSVLTIQNDIDKLENEIAKYQHIGKEKAPLWKIWRLLAPLYRDGTVFKFIRYNGQQVFISVEADSATNILEYFIDANDAEEPGFTTSIKKKKNRDSFTLKFTLSDDKELNNVK